MATTKKSAPKRGADLARGQRKTKRSARGKPAAPKPRRTRKPKAEAPTYHKSCVAVTEPVSGEETPEQRAARLRLAARFDHAVNQPIAIMATDVATIDLRPGAANHHFSPPVGEHREGINEWARRRAAAQDADRRRALRNGKILLAVILVAVLLGIAARAAL